jgi:FeS assembly SUF system protein
MGDEYKHPGKGTGTFSAANDQEQVQPVHGGKGASPPLSLNVLPSSGKVDQLKAEIAAEGGPKKLADQNVIDRAVDQTTTPRQKMIREKVIDAVRGVYDPEIPINIYDLGLIYEINVHEDDSVHVKMTLTAPACPVAGTLPGEVEKRIENVPEVKSAKVELVWEPPWDKSRMSEEAILELGL